MIYVTSQHLMNVPANWPTRSTLSTAIAEYCLICWWADSSHQSKYQLMPMLSWCVLHPWLWELDHQARHNLMTSTNPKIKNNFSLCTYYIHTKDLQLVYHNNWLGLDLVTASLKCFPPMKMSHVEIVICFHTQIKMFTC